MSIQKTSIVVLIPCLNEEMKCLLFSQTLRLKRVGESYIYFFLLFSLPLLLVRFTLPRTRCLHLGLRRALGASLAVAPQLCDDPLSSSAEYVLPYFPLSFSQVLMNAQALREFSTIFMTWSFQNHGVI